MREEDIPIAETRDCETGCGKHIVFACVHTKRDGTRVFKPLDVKPSEAGKFTLTRTIDGATQRPLYMATELKKLAQLQGARAAGQQLHTSHGMTCPKRDEWLRTHGRKKR